MDLGTSYTAATIARDGGAGGSSLGADSAVVPSVVYIGTDGARLYGHAVADVAAAESERVLRGFVRRIGDETPMIPAVGAASAAHRVAADLVAWVVDQASVQEGRAPDAVAVTHPATWGPHKRELFAAALAEAGVANATLVAEPVAAAALGAQDAAYAPGTKLAIYDLGGRTFDAAVVQLDEAGQTWSVLGRPAELADFGGADFDDLVLAHVVSGLTPDQQTAFAALDAEDAETGAALSTLRASCVAAKEKLSTETAVTVKVALPGIAGSVRLTRSELEGLIAGPLEATVDVLDSVLENAGVAAADLAAVLTIGGSARIPLVTQLVSRQFQRPVVRAGGATPATPATAVAAGAVLALGEASPAAPAPVLAAAKQVVKTAARKPKAAAQAVAAAPEAPVAEAPAAPAIPLPTPTGPSSKPIRPRRGARRPEVVGLEGIAVATPVAPRPAAPSEAPAAMVAEVPRAVIPARAVRSVEALLVEDAPAPVRSAETLPPPRPALEDQLFSAVDDVELEALQAGWTWRSLVSVRRSLALTALTAAIFVGATAWNPATPAITDQPVKDMKVASAPRAAK
ncbi:Hsp70 family protein [Sporichthya brevicatena]|uniref:Hsp70 family protein n=1 Tax=Sporichthya brevicatena TaxID=171442 RepID=UPI0031DCB7C1